MIYSEILFNEFIFSYLSSVSSSNFILANSSFFVFLRDILIGQTVTVPEPFGREICVIYSNVLLFP
jgi:hypothetical protein